MPKSIIEAVKMGLWDFEPPETSIEEFDATCSMPGTKGKLEALAERAAAGLPLWHPSDCCEVDEFDIKKQIAERERRAEEERLYGAPTRPR